MRDMIQELGPQANKQWSRRLLKAGSALIGIAALLDFPLIFTLDPNVSTYVLIGNSVIVLMCLLIFVTSSWGSITWSALLLGSGLMVLTALMPTAEDLLNTSTGAALVVPVLVVGVVTNFRLAMLFGLIAIAILVLAALLNNLAWTPYTYTSAFIISISVGLLWLIHNLIATIHDRNEQLASYAFQAQELAIERERIRVAREIHDSIGHVLMTVNMQIEAARSHFERDPVAGQQALHVAQRYTKQAATEVRHSIVTLRSPSLQALSLPLPEAVAALAKTVRSTMLDVHIDVQGKPRILPPQVTFALNRIVQEGLTNVRKHARATQVAVTLDYTSSERVRVVVHDNGAGSEALGSGYGLLGIQERVEVLEGSVTTTTSPGAGFTLTVEVPA